MKQFGWGRAGTVVDQLLAEPWAFSFFQAVRLLEKIYGTGSVPQNGDEDGPETVRFRGEITQAFPPSDVRSIAAPDSSGGAATLTTALMPLGGAAGPMPAEYSDLVIERSWRKDYATRDFLDIFHHRLLSLLVRTRKRHHPSFSLDSPDQGPIAQYLYAFFGLAPSQMRNRMRIPDRSLLFYAGMLSQQPRSASGLERLLSDYFQIPARIRQMLGGWRVIEDEDRTALGRSGRNRRLGLETVLGARHWDQQCRFEVDFGPMPLSALHAFLPSGSAFATICELTRFYVGPGFAFSFRLTLAAAEVPAACIGGSRLGWTSWVKTRPFQQNDSQLRLRPATT